MAQYSSKDIGFILIDGYSVVGTSTTIQDSVEAILQSTMVLGASWDTFASVNVSRGTLQQSGYYNDAAGSINAALVGSIGATRVFTYNLEANTIGRRFVGFSGAVEAKYERVLALEKLHMANATYNPTGPVELGQVLHAHTAETTATGNTQASSVDNSADVHNTVTPITSNSVANPTIVTTTVPHGLVNGDIIVISGSNSTPTIDGEQTVTVTGLSTFSVPVNVTVGGTAGTFVKAKTTNGGSGYLQVSALTLGGYTDLTIKVQHSADNVTFVDLVTFTAVTSAPTAERKTVASGTTVNRYLAASWAFGGAGSGPSATFMVGFSRA